MNMNQFIACLLLGALFGVTLPTVSAQEDQSPQHLAHEIETLTQRVSELEKKLQTVENVEKLELARNYTDAQAKLLNAEFGKFERELSDSNNEWLFKWLFLILAIVAALGLALWIALKSLIANGIEKNLNGFKEALKEFGLQKNQLTDLEETVVHSMLERTFEPDIGSELGYPRENRSRREDVLKGFRFEKKHY